MGRFETQWLAASENLSALADLSGQWIDLVYCRRPPRGIVLDMDSNVSPTHGEQGMRVWKRHYACTCYHPLFVLNLFFVTFRAGAEFTYFKAVSARLQGRMIPNTVMCCSISR
jgi:Transposase DDE domain group 1